MYIKNEKLKLIIEHMFWNLSKATNQFENNMNFYKDDLNLYRQLYDKVYKKKNVKSISSK
jgi:hypothetical protein